MRSIADQNSNKSVSFIIFILAFSAFSVINTEMGVSGILPEIGQQFNVPLTTASWLVSGFALIVALSGPVTPVYMERFNHKLIMVIVLFLFLISNIISLYTNNFHILMIARIVPAILQPAFFSLAYIVAGNLVKVEFRNQAISKVLMGVSTGFVLGVPISNFIASQVSLHMAILFFAATNLIALVLVIFYVPSTSTKSTESFRKQFSALKDKLVIVSLAIVVVLNASVFGFFSFMSVFLLRFTHLPSPFVSLFLLVYGFANILGNFIAGRRLSKNPDQLIMLIPLLLLAVFVAIFFFGDNATIVFILLGMLGLLAGIVANVIQYVVAFSLKDSPALANGLFVSLGNVGILTGTFINGMVISHFGLKATVIASSIFAVVGLSAIYFRKQLIVKR